MTANSTDPPKGERIAKRLARAGLCSRRDAERWITAGRVQVNGNVLESPALNVLPRDTILVDGKPLPDSEPPALWRYHKPSGLVTTNRDPQGRETIFDRLPSGLPRVMTIGRLDLTTEGLLLLTNDGDLARFLELPSTGWARRYRVRVNGRPDEAALTRLADGVTIDGQRYDAIHAKLDRQQGANAWLTMTIREGKNREIRKVCEYLGLTVNRLIRTSYGPFQLGKLEKGSVEKVPNRIFREQLAHWPGLPATTGAEDEDRPTRLKPRSRSRAGTPAGRGRRDDQIQTQVDNDPRKAERDRKNARDGDAFRKHGKKPSRKKPGGIKPDGGGRVKLRLKPSASKGSGNTSTDGGSQSSDKSRSSRANRRRKP